MTETPYHVMYQTQVSTGTEPPLPFERLLKELTKLREMPRDSGWDNRARSAAIRLMVWHRHGGHKVSHTEAFLDILIDLYSGKLTHAPNHPDTDRLAADSSGYDAVAAD